MTSELAALEARLRRLEDERDIARLIASYGPLVDAADADGTAALWATDGRYEVEGWAMAGRADVHAMVSSTSHRALVATGCSHFLGPAVVTVDGDTAVAVCESLVLVRRETPDDGSSEYGVWRATANHFELARIDGRWQISRRSSRLLNGDPAAHRLLTAGVAGEPAT
ncbi:nuclear transport factor 2 family protein [Mycolicibacterium nivoides]|uniref:Nuclear transport factor 2 family protein n=1 Tax=Mycolicibacterium nivoides TaxID=2487344 RepID=A0ABW9LET1_9MYCO|nr:nuclear transport factor 2 family protein [Mycolicibacterium nivoides]SER65419.1 SnoaL-like domain-containing protein [Mycobacterium sp. 88mf]SFG42703.1 SnoaL-like domain-containing protein [Mycobacterium sp. 455mf]